MQIFASDILTLRGWRRLANYTENWQGSDGECCRLLVGMQRLPDEELRHVLRIFKDTDRIDNQTALRTKKKLAEEFREQLTVGVPTREDEIGLRQLARQLRDRKVKVKLFLRHPLHAKLYLLHRQDLAAPIVGYLGSSNLTMAGLSQQGELNVDVLDADACEKLDEWFDNRWNDRWCIGISKELIEIIEESWAREERIPPYHIYIKMAYHLSHEARAGLNEFKISKEFEDTLFDFQTAAVKIAAHHLNKRGGVLIGDVVGLGKTLMGTALAKIMEDDKDLETLIICPKNLVSMWEYYREEYRLRGKVISISRVLNELPDLRRYRLVMIDESHNLRNREGKRYRAIQEYIHENDSKVILLSATPYNKSFLDLSNQLRLFVDETEDLGIRPDHCINKIGELQFLSDHQCGTNTLAAFEKSEEIDDWRELMRRYLVRRTRSFIMQNYAEEDTTSKRKYLLFPDGTRSYFATRAPKTVTFTIDDKDTDDTYAQLYSNNVVSIINSLNLVRYGLANYIDDAPAEPPTEAAATGDSANPTQLATRFSPVSNNRKGAFRAEDELRVLISTDVLSEGQNLQDCAIVVNYDLPWAIIRLVQRAGRVDRIGQTAEEILCYSFLPAEGVERIIKLRGRVRARLQENAEVVGTDEAFFEDDGENGNQAIEGLYHEHAGLLDDDMDNDVDLASHAYQIWKNAITEDPDLEKIITKLSSVVYSTKSHSPTDTEPEGALVYIRTGEDNDALAWVNKNGESVTESQFTILQAAACEPETETLQPLEEHHGLVQAAAKRIVSEERSIGGQLGRPSGARFRTYERLKDYASEVEGTLFDTAELKQVTENIYRYPLRPVATDILNRQLRLGISNEDLALLVIDLWEDGRLCIVEEEREMQEPKIVCSLGLSSL